MTAPHDSSPPDDFDPWLDAQLAALPRYAPGAGFEDRVMASVRVPDPFAIRSIASTRRRLFASPRATAVAVSLAVFVEASSRNRTPDKLPAEERETLFAACDRHLRRVVRLLEPEWVVGIGAFAEQRARQALGGRVKIGRVLHPSPANPRAQSDWGRRAREELASQGVCRSAARRRAC